MGLTQPQDFKYAGWTFEIGRGDEGHQFKLDETVSSAALLLGRRTYESVAASWPELDGAFADKFNSMAKYVVSPTPQDRNGPTRLWSPATSTTAVGDGVVIHVCMRT